MVTIPSSQEPITYTSRDLINTTWYRFFSEVGQISPFMQTVLDDTSATAALATLGITTGTYTPTLYNVTNIAASTSHVATYLRVSDRVIVSGRVDIDPTTTATASDLGFSLPVASNIGAAADLNGVMGGATTETGIIQGRIADNTAFVTFVAATASNHQQGYIYMYRVI